MTTGAERSVEVLADELYTYLRTCCAEKSHEQKLALIASYIEDERQLRVSAEAKLLEVEKELSLALKVVVEARKVKVERDGMLTKNVLITCKTIDAMCDALTSFDQTGGSEK